MHEAAQTAATVTRAACISSPDVAVRLSHPEEQHQRRRMMPLLCPSCAASVASSFRPPYHLQSTRNLVRVDSTYYLFITCCWTGGGGGRGASGSFTGFCFTMSAHVPLIVEHNQISLIKMSLASQNNAGKGQRASKTSVVVNVAEHSQQNDKHTDIRMRNRHDVACFRIDCMTDRAQLSDRFWADGHICASMRHTIPSRLLARPPLLVFAHQLQVSFSIGIVYFAFKMLHF